MGSFKLKLVLWFALIALLPLGVAFYGYDSIATRSETRRLMSGLESALRGVSPGYATRLDGASARDQLARARVCSAPCAARRRNAAAARRSRPGPQPLALPACRRAACRPRLPPAP